MKSKINYGGSPRSETFIVRVVDPDPDLDPGGSEIICNLGSGSGYVINSGSGFGSKLSSVPTNKFKAVKMYRLKKCFFAMFTLSADLQFKCIFH
jgi:hypothetical protein